MLTAKADGQPNLTATYQWYRSDARDSGFVAIDGATSENYTLTDDDFGKYIKVEVKGTGNYTGTKEKVVGPVAEDPEPEAAVEKVEVSPEPGEISGVQEFTFGFKSVTDALEELELDIYLGENAGDNREYANHLGVNLPANNAEIVSWIEGAVNGDPNVDQKFAALLAAVGLDSSATVEDLNKMVYYTDGEAGAGTWTIKLDTTKLGADKIEFLVAVRDSEGAQWGNNNYVAYPGDVKAFLYTIVAEDPEPEAAVEKVEVSPEPGEISGVQEFTFGFKSVTDALEELELDIYLGENAGDNREYANHLGVNLPANNAEIVSWIEGAVNGDPNVDQKFAALLAAVGLDSSATVEDLNKMVYYTDGEAGAGTWTIKLDTTKLGADKIEFLVAVRDSEGAQWGNNNYVAYPGDVKAFLYTIVAEDPEPEAAVEKVEVSPEPGEISGVQEFTFGFKSVTDALEELELDIYLGENAGDNREYANHLGVNLPANNAEIVSWIEGAVNGDPNVDQKFAALLAAVGLDSSATVEDLNKMVYYTDGEAGAGTWTIKLDTTKLGADKIEFLVAVRDSEGAQWGNNNYVAYPGDVKAFLYTIINDQNQG